MGNLKVAVLGIAALGIISVTKIASADVWATCTPVGVTEFHNDTTGTMNRVHVQCATPYNDAGANISFFSMPVSDQAAANRFLSLMSTALTAGRQVVIQFISGKTTDANNVNFGCGSTNCRWVVASTLQ